MVLGTSISWFQPPKLLVISLCWHKYSHSRVVNHVKELISVKVSLVWGKEGLTSHLASLVPIYAFVWGKRTAWGCGEVRRSGNSFVRGLTGGKIKNWRWIGLEWAEESTATKFMEFKHSWSGIAALQLIASLQKVNSNPQLGGKKNTVIFLSLCVSLCWHSS